jgi:hypothetical protein
MGLLWRLSAPKPVKKARRTVSKVAHRPGGRDHPADPVAADQLPLQPLRHRLRAGALHARAGRRRPPPARLADRRRHLRAPDLRPGAVRDPAAGPAGPARPHRHHQRRVQGIRHDRLADRLRRRAGKAHGCHAGHPEPVDLLPLLGCPRPPPQPPCTARKTPSPATSGSTPSAARSSSANPAPSPARTASPPAAPSTPSPAGNPSPALSSPTANG